MKRCIACWDLESGEKTKRACGRKATHDDGGSPRTDYPCYCPAHAASRLENDHLAREKTAREQRKRETEAEVAVRLARGTLRAAAARFASEGAAPDSGADDVLLEAAVCYATALDEQDRARVPL